MIDRTEHDDRTQVKKERETIDDDPHTDHSLDPDEHDRSESHVPTEAELRDEAETND